MNIPPAATRDAHSGERAIEQISCPFERVKAINVIIHDRGTIPGRLARLRTAALRDGRQLTTSVTDLANKVGMTRTRVSTLLNTTTTPAQDMQPAITGQ